jgi:hypothetical protein
MPDARQPTSEPRLGEAPVIHFFRPVARSVPTWLSFIMTVRRPSDLADGEERKVAHIIGLLLHAKHVRNATNLET